MSADLRIYVCDQKHVLDIDGALPKAEFAIHRDSELLDQIEALPSMELAGGLVIGDDNIRIDEYGDKLRFADCDKVAECIKNTTIQNEWNNTVAGFLTQVKDRYKAVLFWK
jgi:hypothetical protein